MSNEVYLKQHPELHIMISIFLFRILEEKPEDLLQYAGRFFNQPNLKEVLQIEKQHYLENNSKNWQVSI